MKLILRGLIMSDLLRLWHINVLFCAKHSIVDSCKKKYWKHARKV